MKRAYFSPVTGTVRLCRVTSRKTALDTGKTNTLLALDAGEPSFGAGPRGWLALTPTC